MDGLMPESYYDAQGFYSNLGNLADADADEVLSSIDRMSADPVPVARFFGASAEGLDVNDVSNEVRSTLMDMYMGECARNLGGALPELDDIATRRATGRNAAVANKLRMGSDVFPVAVDALVRGDPSVFDELMSEYYSR